MTMHLIILKTFGLEEEEKKLCFTFEKKTLKSRHKDMFVEQHQHDTRQKTQLYENNANNGRYLKSPLNYLTRLLNAEK